MYKKNYTEKEWFEKLQYYVHGLARRKLYEAWFLPARYGYLNNRFIHKSFPLHWTSTKYFSCSTSLKRWIKLLFKEHEKARQFDRRGFLTDNKRPWVWSTCTTFWEWVNQIQVFHSGKWSSSTFVSAKYFLWVPDELTKTTETTVSSNKNKNYHLKQNGTRWLVFKAGKNWKKRDCFSSEI